MWEYNHAGPQDELQHHGIKGQKWGIRRYQNTDGSLTPAGRKRYGVDVVPGIQAKIDKKYNKKIAKYQSMEGTGRKKQRIDRTIETLEKRKESRKKQEAAIYNDRRLKDEYFDKKRNGASKEELKAIKKKIKENMSEGIPARASLLYDAGIGNSSNKPGSLKTEIGKNLVKEWLEKRKRG